MAEASLKAVQVSALTVMKIIKHASQMHPTTATGSLVGMEVNGVLEVTNSFPFPLIDVPSGENSQQDNQSNIAAAMPRAKQNTTYQAEMIKMLREVNVDANNVGWYTSTNMGNFINGNTIENQFFYQKDMNDSTVALVYDTSRSTQGSLALRAFRLSAAFITAYKEGKFTIESLQKSNLRYQDVLQEIPVVVHNSYLLTSLLHQMPSDPPSGEIDFPVDLADISKSHTTQSFPLEPNFDSLDLSIDPFLEKTCDLLLDSIETHHVELNNHQYYQRSLAREQSKITAWQTKRKAENATRAATKQPLLPEDEWQRLFKLPTEPSRLETMINSRQVEQYARQVDGFSATISGKMFAVKSNLLPGDS